MHSKRIGMDGKPRLSTNLIQNNPTLLWCSLNKLSYLPTRPSGGTAIINTARERYTVPCKLFPDTLAYQTVSHGIEIYPLVLDISKNIVVSPLPGVNVFLQFFRGRKNLLNSSLGQLGSPLKKKWIINHIRLNAD